MEGRMEGRMAAAPEGEWQLECSGAVFESVRDDPEFAFLMALARS